MARIAGISFTKTTTGKLKSVTFDLKKHGDIIKPVLQKIGAIEQSEEDREFEEAYSRGIPAEQVRQELLAKIRAYPWKKK